MVDLKSFFEEYDVESLRAKVLLTDGVDICGVYCLNTGKVMGEYTRDEILFAIDEIGVEDEDTLIDDLLVRVIASMRPSPAMNKPNRATIQQMVDKRPVDALAYLANRLAGNRHVLIHRDGEASFQPLLNRIAIHKQWTELADAGMDLKPWIHWLLELDAKMNLHDIVGPSVSLDKSNKWILGAHGTPLLMLVTTENQAELLKVFESWTFDRLAEYDRRDREALQESQWYKGNTHSKSAYVRSWIDNPEIANRKLAEAHAKKGKAAKTGRPAVSPRTQKLNAEVNQFLHLLEGIMDGAIEQPPAPKPAPRLLTGGMLKLNLAKKEA